MLLVLRDPASDWEMRFAAFALLEWILDTVIPQRGLLFERASTGRVVVV